MRELPEPVERVAEHVRRHGAEVRIEEFVEGTPTAADAARAVGAKLGQIVKSLVFVCDGRYVVVLVPGDRRADESKIAAAAGASQARVASAKEVLDATGYEAGGVAPFPLPKVDRVFVDRALLAQPRVWIGAGTPRHMAALGPGDLVRLSRAHAMDAVERST